MVATKYFVSLNSLRAEDGSFKSGIAVDYKAAIDNLLEKNSSFSTDNLIAVNSLTRVATTDDKSNKVVQATEIEQNSSNSSTASIQRNNSEEPLPMEYGNSLVVYDFSNPDNNLVSSNFADIDIEDDIPLDNGNTIINGLMLIMPRR